MIINARVWFPKPLNANLKLSDTHFTIISASQHDMDGFQIGLNGKQAAYGNKKYQGHRALQSLHELVLIYIK
jgi:hypothetical protein